MTQRNSEVGVTAMADIGPVTAAICDEMAASPVAWTCTIIITPETEEWTIQLKTSRRVIWIDLSRQQQTAEAVRNVLKTVLPVQELRPAILRR